MAAKVMPMKYAHKELYNGNAAYKLERPEWNEPQEEQARPAPVRKPKTSARRAEAYSVSFASMLGIAAAAVLVVFMLLAYVSYAEMTNQTVALQERIEELTEQERKLSIEYEERFDITDVEAYASGVLSMSRPDDDQIVDLDLHVADRAVVLAEGEQTAEEADVSIGGLMQFFGSLAAYFK